jgi:hypothetical protein
MREIDDTGETGVFGEIAWIDPQNPATASSLERLCCRTSATRAKVQSQLSARWWHQISRALDFNLGGGFIYADDNDHYFGVNAARRRRAREGPGQTVSNDLAWNWDVLYNLNKEPRK